MGAASDYPDASVIARLSQPEVYPRDPDAAAGVDWIQTHLSHVYLTRTRVYKFRKAVDLPFVCFTERRERNADCLREVALNRRLAPDVYLGVAPLEVGPCGPRVGEVSEALAGSGASAPEHCVVMRRLPEGRDALSLLERGALSPAQLDRLAERVASFHARHGLGVPAPFAADAWRERCTEPLAACFDALVQTGAPVGPSLSRARERARVFVRDQADRFERRRLRGRAVDAHGDLHLQHVWFERHDAEPLVIDCLEFDRALREIDAAAEVAFTAMDLGYRGRADLGSAFLRRYARASDDFDLYGVVDFFVGYRAAVRAKVAAIAATDADIDGAQRAQAAESARRHVELAARALAPPRDPGTLVLVGGVVGTGKTSAAEVLAEALDGEPGSAVVSSDRVRKHIAGIDPLARTGAGPDEGLYAPEAVARTYAGLLERARPVLRSGRVAVLDATWSSRAERRLARQLAAGLAAPAIFVEARCDASLTLERLRLRRERGGDASAAGPERLAPSIARFEPVEPGEGFRHRELDTGAARWRDEVVALAGEISQG